MTPAEAIAAADHADAETRYRNQLGREMYEAGRRDGEAAGRRATEADEAAAWSRLHNEIRGTANSPTQSELEERRWGPGGREHFADPRPGDFPGRQHEREREMEAG